MIFIVVTCTVMSIQQERKRYCGSVWGIIRFSSSSKCPVITIRRYLHCSMQKSQNLTGPELGQAYIATASFEIKSICKSILFRIFYQVHNREFKSLKRASKYNSIIKTNTKTNNQTKSNILKHLKTMFYKSHFERARAAKITEFESVTQHSPTVGAA